LDLKKIDGANAGTFTTWFLLLTKDEISQCFFAHLTVVLLIGILSCFYGYIIEQILCVPLADLISLIGERRTWHLYILEVMPLEIYHCPLIDHLMLAP
jgi:hypothetical protein